MYKDYNFIIKLTTSCPGNCKCCINRRRSFASKTDNKIFDIDKLRMICEKTKEIGGTYICFSGGEPTIVPNLDKYIKLVHSYGLASRINSNGWGLTKENLVKYLENGLDQVVISVYGITEDIVTETRGNPFLFERTDNACSLLKEMKEQYDFILILQTIIMRDNYFSLPEIMSKAIDIHADFFWPSYLEDAKNLTDICMRPRDIDDFCKNIRPKLKEVLKENGYDYLLKTVDKIYDKKYQDCIYHDKNYKCPLLGRHLTLYPNGIADPCPGHEYFFSKAQKNYNEVGIEKIINKKNLLNNKKYCFKYCKFCPQGEHVGFCFHEKEIDEHSASEILYKSKKNVLKK